MLSLVGIPDARSRLSSYPHEFSGGMRQRAMIAMALINEPKLLIADEPTTALDVTVQAQILELIQRLQQETGTAVIMITHDLGVVAEITHDIAVMYAGRVVERAPTTELFAAPQHPYTWGLLRSIPRLDTPRDEELVPIEGRPPSLINRPIGLRVPPALPVRARRAHADRPEARAGRRRGGSRGRLPAPADRADRDLAAAPGRRGPAAREGRRPVGRRRRMSDNIVEVRDLVKEFPITGSYLARRRQLGAVHAVDGISFDVRRGETFGLVGESGCGKSTTARLLLRLLEPTSGEIMFDGREIAQLKTSEIKPLRREMQMIFQDPYSSLNPRRTVGTIISEPFRIHGLHKGEGERKKAVQDLMDTVGLNPEHYNRYPHEFSGGQRQRIGVARALALKPKLIVADEPVSALDVSIQAQILNLLRDLQRELGLTLIFIAHDLSVVRHMCDRVAVMYLGRIVEMAPSEQLYDASADAVHGRADVGGTGRGPAARRDEEAPGARRGRALADEPAGGVPLPHALLEGAGDLLAGGPAARAQGRRQPRRVPLPAHGRRGRRAGAVRPRGLNERGRPVTIG